MRGKNRENTYTPHTTLTCTETVMVVTLVRFYSYVHGSSSVATVLTNRVYFFSKFYILNQSIVLGGHLLLVVVVVVARKKKKQQQL